MTTRPASGRRLLARSVGLVLVAAACTVPGREPSVPDVAGTVHTTTVRTFGPAASSMTEGWGADYGLLLHQGMVIASSSDRTLRVFSERGEARRVTGGAGSGPGEFRQIRGMARIGSGFGVWDPLSQRVTMYSEEGTLSRVVTIRPPADAPGGVMYLVGFTPDSLIVVRHEHAEMELAAKGVGIVSTESFVGFYDLDGVEVSGRRLVVDDLDRWRFNGTDGAWGAIPLLFANAPRVAVVEDLLAVSSDDSDGVRLMGPHADTVAMVAVARRAAPSRAQIKAERDLRMLAVRTPHVAVPAAILKKLAETEREAIENVPSLSLLPAVRDLRYDGRTLWIGQWTDDTASYRWLTVTPPYDAPSAYSASFGPQVVDWLGDRVLTSQRDSMGLNHITLSRVVIRPGRQPPT